MTQHLNDIMKEEASGSSKNFFFCHFSRCFSLTANGQILHFALTRQSKGTTIKAQCLRLEAPSGWQVNCQK